MPTTWDCRRPANTWCNKSVETQVFAVVEPPCGEGTCPWVQEWPTGESAFCFTATGNIHWQYSNFALPSAGTLITSVPVETGDAKCGRFMRDPRTLRIYLIYERDALGVYTKFSDDHGQSWSGETLLASAGMDASNHASHTGELFEVWAEYVSGSSGPMVAKGKTRGPGDSAWSATFTFKDSAGTNIQIADGGMSNVFMAHDGFNRIVWTPIKYGDTTPTVYFSTDNGRTWKS